MSYSFKLTSYEPVQSSEGPGTPYGGDMALRLIGVARSHFYVDFWFLGQQAYKAMLIISLK